MNILLQSRRRFSCPREIRGLGRRESLASFGKGPNSSLLSGWVCWHRDPRGSSSRCRLLAAFASVCKMTKNLWPWREYLCPLLAHCEPFHPGLACLLGLPSFTTSKVDSDPLDGI